jgi:hypothetical protein
MVVHLIVAEGKHEGKVISINVPQFIIGRHKQCQLRAGSSKVSKHHCALIVRDEKALVRDFDSVNGTFVNGERVKGERELHNEDCLKIGPLVFLLWLEAGQAASEKPGQRTSPPVPPGDSTIVRLLLGTKKGEAATGILGLGEDSSSGSTVLQSAAGAAKGKPGKKSDLPRKSKTPPAAAEMPAAARSILEKYKSRSDQ